MTKKKRICPLCGWELPAVERGVGCGFVSLIVLSLLFSIAWPVLLLVPVCLLVWLFRPARVSCPSCSIKLDCPHECGYVFQEKPARKRKCPQCKQDIFIKSPMLDTPKVLMTQADA